MARIAPPRPAASLPKKLKLRFGVTRRDGYRSYTWKIEARKNDVYLAQREGPPWQKFSFHGSGDRCRFGFTDQYIKANGMPPGLTDRVLTRWQKAPIPPLPRSGSVVAELVIPTDFLSRLSAEPDGPGKRILWLPAAPPRQATVIDVFFTHDDEALIRGATFNDRPLNLFGYASLQGGEKVAVTWRYADYDGEPLRMPGSANGTTLLFSADDPQNTGRPVRITFQETKVPTGTLTIFELGGYPVP